MSLWNATIHEKGFKGPRACDELRRIQWKGMEVIILESSNP